MPFLVSLAEIRDAFIIVYGTIGIVFFVVASIITLVVGFSLRSLVKNLNSLLDESVRPTLASVKDTADTVRGTTEFVGRTAVAPLVKTYGTLAGLKKGLSVLSGLGNLKKKD